MLTLLALPALDALQGAQPVALPALLAALGVVAVSVGALRRRSLVERAGARRVGRLAGRAALVGYLVVAFTSFGAAGLLLVESWRLFSDARWDGDAGEVVLVRWGPIPDVRVDSDDIVSVTEVSLPTRGINGPRRVVHLVLHTVQGAEYWSAPLSDGDAIRSMQRELTVGTSPTIHQFRVGGGTR